MQRRLAVTAACVHGSGVPLEQVAQTVGQTKPGCRVCINRSPALDGVGRNVRARAVQHAEPSCPPAAAAIDVGTSVEQDVEHPPAADIHDWRRIE